MLLDSVWLRVIPLLVAVLASSSTHGQVSGLQIVSGDRQIAVNTFVPPQPYVVRAVDAQGTPVQGATLVIQTSGMGHNARLQDEFHFRGFNTIGFLLPSDPLPEYVAVTDVNGLASARGRYADGAPSSFIVSATATPLPTAVPPIYFFTTLVTAPPPGNPMLVVEYFDAALDHYFNTLYQAEIDALDTGRFPGWTRSIGSFIGWATSQDAPPGALPVCRFFSSLYTSHFYTADADECDAVIAKWPDIWQLESPAAFYIFLPDKATGACAPGMQPVYRLYNDRPDPNHRYVTDSALRDRMRNAGWIPEGYGPDSVIMCTPK